MSLPNTDPIFSRVPDVQWIGSIVTANTTADLTSGTKYTAFTADATNGGFLSRIRFRPIPGGNTTATVARIWLNNGATAGTVANNTLWDEITLPSITASAVAATNGYELPLNFAIPAAYVIYITIATGSATGWFATVIGGKY